MTPTDSSHFAADGRYIALIDVALDEALAGDLDAMFQPIFELRSNEAFAHELLSRPQSGTNPFELLGRAANRNLRFELETAMLDCAADAIRVRGHKGLFFINTSPAVACDPRYCAFLTAFADRARIQLSRLVVELTEQYDHIDPAKLKDTCRAIRKLGASLAIDDLGAGGSGLCRLATVKPDWVKLDRHFIAGIEEDNYRLALIRTISTFAEAWGGSVLAEGIETDAQKEALAGIGVRFGQGFGLARPASSPIETPNAWNRGVA